MKKIITLSSIIFAIFVTGCQATEETVPPEIDLEEIPTGTSVKQENFGVFSFTKERLALNWLKTQQNNDGTWGDEKNKDILTPLVILAFMSGGHSPASEDYGENVKKGIIAIVKRMDDKSLKLTEPAKTISIWSLAETYSYTRIPMLETYLSDWLKAGKFDFSSPYTPLALLACYCSGVGEKKVIAKNLGFYLKSNKNDSDSLLGKSSKTYILMRNKDREDFKKLFEELSDLDFLKWRKSDNPMLNSVYINKAILDAPYKEIKKFQQAFWPEIWKSQTVKDNMGRWSEKSLGIENNPDLKGLSEKDKSIYITSMLMISVPPTRYLPTFKSFDIPMM